MSILEWAVILSRKFSYQIMGFGGFPGGTVVGSLPANAGDTGSSLGPGGSHTLRST